MNRLLVILLVLVALLSLVQNAPVGRQRGKNKNKLKKTAKVRERWLGIFFHRLNCNLNLQDSRISIFLNLQGIQELD